ncbi:GGDEF domain-containing protein [Desulfovibrio sp. OttesenSCG-928-F20]|nr:GGDEF domain-containing protein [Desulfovibrio sp. OttesenSCG-928-F20]
MKRKTDTAMSKKAQEADIAQQCVAHILGLLRDAAQADLPPELAGLDGMQELHDCLLSLRQSILLLTEGDLSQDIALQGHLPGLLKAHIASLTQLNKSLRQEVELRSTAVHALKQTRAHFKYLADHDPLTGALNRRSFLLLAEAGLKQAKLNLEPCCVALLDMDHFKRFYESYGPLDGDKALKHLVNIGSMNLRQKDSLGRYAGEQLVFFFAEADMTIGLRVAERILQAVRMTTLSLDCSDVYLTASMGLCVIRPEWEGERDSIYIQRAIGLADAALLKAKQQGRDRVCVAPEDSLC